MEFVKDWLITEEQTQKSMRRLLYWGTLLATFASTLVVIWGVA